MVRVFFPNMFMRLISINTNVVPNVAKLQVSPRMTKTEVKEYLTKVYNVNVLGVDTANYLGKHSCRCYYSFRSFHAIHLNIGKWKKLYGKRKIIAYKRRNFKAAFVTFGEASESNSPAP